MSRWDGVTSTVGADRLIAALGGLYVVLAVVHAIGIAARGSTYIGIISSLLLVAGPGLLILYGGYRLPTTDLHPDTYPRIVAWLLGGFGLLLGVVGLRVLSPGVTIDEAFWSAALATAIGSVAGLAIGMNEARAFSRARDAEQHRDELRQERDLREQIVETSPTGIVVVDADGSISSANRYAAESLGFTEEELAELQYDAPIFEATTPEGSPAVGGLFQQVLSTGEPMYNVERQITRADGQRIWLSVNGAPLPNRAGHATGVIFAFEDITDRKEYERDLEQYKTVAHTASDVIVTIDEQSRIQSVNPAVDHVFGYEPAELMGEPLTMLIPDSLREQHRATIQQYLRTGERTLDWEYIELPGLHKEGHEIPLAISFNEFEQDGNQFFTGIIRDNTERKALENELRQERDLRDRIFETSPTGILVVDIEGTISFVNEYAVELIGQPEKEMRDLESLFETVEVTTPDGTPVDGDLFRQILATGNPIYDVERQITRPDGQQHWLSVNGSPLRDSFGEVTAVVFTLEDITERKHYQDRLISINELSLDLTDIETPQTASDLAVETAREILPLPLIAIALYDEEDGTLRFTAQTEAVTELVGDDPLFASERDLPWQVFSEQTQAVYDDLHEQIDMSESETPLRSALILPLGQNGVFISGATSTDAFSDLDVSLAQMLVSNTGSALDRVEREQTVREQRDTLAERTAALERVQRVNEIIRGITTDLVQASTREEIMQAVCDRLATAEAYRFAWIGTHDTVTDEVTPEAWAGEEESYLELVTVTADTTDDRSGPTGEAVTTRETQVRNNLAADPPFASWQQAALDRGYQASIAIPLGYQDALYGVLTLFAGQPDVFNEMEETVLTELGETIGYALNALERRQALVSDRSVELEFQLRGGRPPFFRFAAEHYCEFEFENIVQRADGSPGIFFTIRGVSTEEVLAFGGQTPDIDELTLVSDRGEEALFEARLRDSAFFSALLDRSAMPQTLTASGDEGYAVIRVPRTSDIRSFVELFETQYEEVNLVGRQEVDEPIKTQQEFESEFRSQLTKREVEILKTAYVSGFFESPRVTTAQELAERLGVSQPTVSRHIRAGERKLFGLVFDDE